MSGGGAILPLAALLQRPGSVSQAQEAARPLTASTPEEEVYALRRLGRAPSLHDAIAVLRANYPAADPSNVEDIGFLG